MSISPFCSAPSIVCWSDMATHSTRSTLAILAPARPDGGSERGLYFGVLDVDRLVAGLPFLLHEDERTRAGVVLDLLVGIGLGHPLGHDEGVARGLAQRRQHDAGRRLELDLEGLGIERLHLGDLGKQHLPQRIAHRPALKGGHDVLGRDGRAVMEFEPVAQGEGPGELVVGGRPLVDHLGLDLEVAVGREQRVVDHVAVVAHDVGRRPDRIEDLQVGVIDHAQGRLRPGRRRGGPRHAKRAGRDQRQNTIAHFPHLPYWSDLTASWGGRTGLGKRGRPGAGRSFARP